MIKNERQYRITKTQVSRFQESLDSLQHRSNEAERVHPRIAQVQRDAVQSQLADLEHELREYESLKRGGFQLAELDHIAELPTLLIKARIAQGLSQRDLAERLGVKEQQIQRYEATDYVSASLGRIQEVASALSE